MEIKITGLDNLIKKIEQATVTPEKANKIAYRLAKIGEEELEKAYSEPKIDIHTPTGDLVISGPNVDMGVDQIGNETTLWAKGEDLLFYEFGTGVTHNTPRSWDNVLNIPVPSEILDIGTYGKGYGSYEYWFYSKPWLRGIKTYGIKARAGFPNAINRMVDEVDEVIKEVMNEGGV